MNITITGKELKATEAIKDYAEKKLTRIEKYFGEENIDVTVTIKKENASTEIAEMYVSVKGMSYKAVTEDRDLYASIDKDIDILEGQIRKTKAKREKMMKDSSIKQMNINGIGEEKPVEDEVIKSISYDEMLEMSSMGAKVLHNRCVEIGKKYNVPIYVKSTFEKNSIGTLVNTNNNLEDLVINGVTKDDYISRITIVGLENKIGKTFELFKILSKNLINIDVISQSFGEHITKDIAFTVKMNDLSKTLEVLNEHKSILGIQEILHSENLAKVSIIGVGIANKPGVAADMFEALYENSINMHMISTSEIKISVLVDSKDSDLAVKAIHKKFFNK